jgi:hypothetical protein
LVRDTKKMDKFEIHGRSGGGGGHSLHVKWIKITLEKEKQSHQA